MWHKREQIQLSSASSTFSSLSNSWAKPHRINNSLICNLRFYLWHGACHVFEWKNKQQQQNKKIKILNFQLVFRILVSFLLSCKWNKEKLWDQLKAPSGLYIWVTTFYSLVNCLLPFKSFYELFISKSCIEKDNTGFNLFKWNLFLMCHRQRFSFSEIFLLPWLKAWNSVCV